MLSGGSYEEALELEIAVGEVLTNAFLHAYRKDHGPLQVDLTYDDRQVELSIRDEGAADARRLVIPSGVEPADEHRGLYLVGQMTDHAEILHPRNGTGGTTVRMVKRIRKFRDVAAPLHAGTDLRGGFQR